MMNVEKEKKKKMKNVLFSLASSSLYLSIAPPYALTISSTGRFASSPAASYGGHLNLNCCFKLIASAG
jgi:hypothetical protein